MDMMPPVEDLTTTGPDLWGTHADLAGPPDMARPPHDMANQPGDMATSTPDLALNPPDLAGPPVDLARPPVDLAGPPIDLAGPPIDLAGPPVDLARPPVDLAGPVDLARPPVDLSGPSLDLALPVDMSMSPGDMAHGAGAIGAPCTDDASCSGGPAPKCWKNNILNNTANPATPGGYCSSTCTSDAQCGAGNSCVNLGPGSYCLAGCNNATTCRHPGYACTYYGPAGVCFPDARLDCDPKAAMGACTETGTGKPGGCLREAYENKGVCSASCTVGAGTCGALGGVNRQCIFIDTTTMTSMDNWKGPICVQSPATPVPAGGMCTFLNDCQDGYQCDNVSATCQQLCTKGGMPMCMAGMCADAFGTAMGGPGLCR
jgi:hypothetical protein